MKYPQHTVVLLLLHLSALAQGLLLIFAAKAACSKTLFLHLSVAVLPTNSRICEICIWEIKHSEIFFYKTRVLYKCWGESKCIHTKCFVILVGFGVTLLRCMINNDQLLTYLDSTNWKIPKINWYGKQWRTDYNFGQLIEEKVWDNIKHTGNFK